MNAFKDAFGRNYNLASDQFTKAIDEIGSFEIIQYDSFGSKTKYTDKNGNSTSYEYDNLMRLTKTTDAASYTEIREYDGNEEVEILDASDGWL